MHKILILMAIVVSLAGCGTLAPTKAKDLVNEPAYYKTVASGYSYQESIKRIKEELEGTGFSCNVYSDLKFGECTQVVYQTGVYRVAFYITVKEIDENSATVAIYAFWKRWLDIADKAAGKLVK